MAGDWIKFETVTMDKPEVFQIAAELKISPEATVGHLLRIWVWADQQSLDGHALNVTDVTLDAVARCPGFAKAMLSTGWLAENDGKLEIPNFDRHNGESAKKRALSTRRKQRERAKNTSRNERDKNATREEKRRYIPPKSPTGDLGANKLAQNKSMTNREQSNPAELQISKCRYPNRLSTICRAHGWGDPPAGMDFEAAKAWAMSKAQAEARESKH